MLNTLLSITEHTASITKPSSVFFAKRTLPLKETPNSTEQLNENENYNEILDSGGSRN
jgi:hypothetical protein